VARLLLTPKERGLDLRVREGLRLMAEGMPAIRAAQLAQVDRHTLGKARRSGAHMQRASFLAMKRL
jgi:hypothetical protein